jgi:HTH-type transcriptional regulator, sugar sensing transcriptional regulator
MKDIPLLLNFGFTQYEAKAYVALVAQSPLNGSQLSQTSRVPRAKIYDTLRSLKDKGWVAELGQGLFAPLPPEELLKRLRHGYAADLDALEEAIKDIAAPPRLEYIWSMRGYERVMSKAREMIASAEFEIYLRVFPEEARVLDRELIQAAERRVTIKQISFGPPVSKFEHQVIHPDFEMVSQILGGRNIELVVDGQEALTGRFSQGEEDQSAVIWTRNQWVVIVVRDGLRHDFFHYFMRKIYDDRQELSPQEKRTYDMIKVDNWGTTRGFKRTRTENRG